MKKRLYRYEIPLHNAPWKTREGLLLELEHPDGSGWGEIAPLPGFSCETLAEAIEEVRSLPHTLPKLPSVRFGLASALKPFDRSPLSLPLSGFQRADGFSTVKWKVGHLSPFDAAELLRRYADKRVRLDANRKWSLEEALLFASHADLSPLDYFEEPLSHIEDLPHLPFPIALDETFRESHLPLTPKALVVKPTLAGSLPLTPLPIVLSSSYETGVGLLSIARLAPQNPLPLGLDTLRFFSYDLLSPPLRLEHGLLTWPGNPTSDPIDRSRLCPIAL